MIVKGLIALLALFIVPELMGLLILKFFKDEKNNLIFAFIIGYLAEFAISQLITVPLIYLGASLTLLVIILVIIFVGMSVASIILNYKNAKEIYESTLNYIKEIPKLQAVIVVVLVCMQIYAFVGYMHIDDDDAYYVGTATTAIQTDSLFKYSATTGEENSENKLARYRLGPFPIYSAVISKLVNIHPAIVSHAILPVIFIPLVYMTYGLIADELFKKDKKLISVFLILLSVINIWGNYSIRSNFSFLLIRIWQGKSLLANLILPAIIWLFIKLEKNNYNFKYCVLLSVTILAGIFMTTMGIALPPMELMLLAIVYEISKINFRNLKDSKEEKDNLKIRGINLAKCLGCCIPAIIYGLAYLII